MKDNIRVKKLKTARLAIWISYSLSFIVTGAVLMMTGMLYEGLFFLIPAICSVFIFLSFYGDGSNGAAIAGMIIRLLLVLAGILVPALIWYLVDAAKENVSVFHLFVPPAITLGSYIISIVFLILLANRKDKEEFAESKDAEENTSDKDEL